MLVIIGGGLVGLSLALALAPSGLPLTIIEKNKEPAPDAAVRTIALAHGAMMVYRTLGLWPAFAPLVAPIHRVHVSEQKRFAKTYISAKEQGLEALGYVINVAALRKVLWDALAQYPEVQILAPAEVIGLEANADGWQLALDKYEQIQAKLVLVADGADSSVAKLLGLTSRQEDYEQQALVANIRTSNPSAGVAFERFTAAGPIALLPQPGGFMAMVYASVEAKTWLQAESAALIHHIQGLLPGQLGRLISISDLFAYPLSLRQIDMPIQAHLLCLGNAARVMHPIAAQGFNLAMRDIAHLMDCVASANEDLPLGSLTWLQTYHASRQKDEARTMHFTDSLVRVFQADHMPMTCLRGLGLQTLQLSPSLKRWFGLYTTGNLGSLPKLMRGLSPWKA